MGLVGSDGAGLGVVTVIGIGWPDRLKLVGFMTGGTVIVVGIENELKNKSDEMV